MVFPGKRLYGVERKGFVVVDPWKAYVSDISIAMFLIALLLCSGLWKKHSDVCHVSLHSVVFIHGRY
jgi:hypothetical protein